MSQHRSYQTTILQVGVIVVIVTVAAGLVLPAMQGAREAARRMSCSSNLRQFGIGLLNYEYSYKKLPSLSAGFGLPDTEVGSSPYLISKNSISPNAGRWSGFVGMIPMFESSTTYNEIVSGYKERSHDKSVVVFGPYGQFSNGWATPKDQWYKPVTVQRDWFRCPSDPWRHDDVSIPVPGRVNYAFNLGDSQVGQSLISLEQVVTRGPFMRGKQLNLSDIRDGTSNTIMFGEIATSNRDVSIPRSGRVTVMIQGITNGSVSPSPDRPLQGIDIEKCRKTATAGYYRDLDSKVLFETHGTRWLDALPCYTGFTTINPPNSSSCADSLEGEGIYTAGSYHKGACHVLMFDNSIKLIPDDIDTSTPSGYHSPGIRYDPDEEGWEKSDNWDSKDSVGVWGDLGTRGLHDD
jgi:hypothetical protein